TNRCALAVAPTDQRREAATGDDAHPRAKLVEHDQRDGREKQDPQEPVTEVGAQNRIGRDPSRIVVGKTREDARPDDRGERDEAGPAMSPVGGGGPNPANPRDGRHRASLRSSTMATASESERLRTLLETGI